MLRAGVILRRGLAQSSLIACSSPASASLTATDCASVTYASIPCASSANSTLAPSVTARNAPGMGCHGSGGWGISSTFRGFASEPISMTEHEFHEAGDKVLDIMSEKLEALLDTVEVEGSDIEYSVSARGPRPGAGGPRPGTGGPQGVLTLKLGSMGAFVLNNQVPNCQQGVLTLKLGSMGTFVLNKQVPNRQVWLSSPVSGPYRFDPNTDGRWIYSRTGQDMLKQLEKEIGDLLQTQVTLE
eukprot:gene27383-4687_t